MVEPAPGHRPTATRPVAWIALGAVAGAAVTAGLVLAVVAALRPDPPPTALPAPRFVEEAATAGVTHVYDGGFEFFVGGGVAAFDCDDNGLTDLYFAGGENPAALFRNAGETGGPLSFRRSASPSTDLTSVTGAYPLDFDSDGLADLAVLRVGENVLLRGTGDCTFERANQALGFDGGDGWTAAFTAMWEPGARLPTMVFANYLESAEVRECAPHDLIRPGGSGGFAPPTPLGPGNCALSALFSDWGGTGRMDLRMTNDRHYYRQGHEQLWKVGPGADPIEYTSEDGWLPVQIWGMGIASQDLTGDGRPEVYLTSQGDNKLQTLDGDGAAPTFLDVALARGVTAHRPFTGDDPMPSTAWHAEFQDVNNDGLFDLFVSKGNVEAMPEFAMADPSNLLLGQNDGTFVESAEPAGIVDFRRGRGAALVDLNLDGLLDLVQVDRGANVELWRNFGPASANWLAIRVRQSAPNIDAVGARLEVRIGDRVVHEEITVGGGHAGGQLGWSHFGLGDADSAEVRVTWPDGGRGPWIEVMASGHHIIERDAPAAVAWRPPESRGTS